MIKEKKYDIAGVQEYGAVPKTFSIFDDGAIMTE